MISPLYKINENVSAYVSWQYGEKAGIAQFTNGVSNLAKAEKSSAYESGIKAVFGRRASLTAGPANGRFVATISIPNVALAP